VAEENNAEKKPQKSSSVLRQKSLYFEFHSGLDPESNDFNWIPAFAGMTASELM